MKYLVSKRLLIFLCFVELFKVASSNRKKMDIIDNFIGLAEPLNNNNNEIAKRNSIVDGGVFVPYKSTTIVYKSRLVPVTYGFVIKKESLKDNPALYKLGVKLLDEKAVEPPKKEVLDEKKVKSATKSLLDAKSTCVQGSKVLRLLTKLSKDINKIEKAILAQNQPHESAQETIIAKSLKKTNQSAKPRPQNEEHVTGHKGMFEKELNNKSSNHNVSMSRYWHCRRSYTKRKCAALFLIKHVYTRRHHKQGRDEGHYSKHHKYPVRDYSHKSRHPSRHITDERDQRKHNNDNSMKYPAKDDSHKSRHPSRHILDEKEDQGKHNNDYSTKYPGGHERKHPSRHILGHKRKNNDSAKHLDRLRKRKKTFRKKDCKHCKVKHRHRNLKHSSRKHKS